MTTIAATTTRRQSLAATPEPSAEALALFDLEERLDRLAHTIRRVDDRMARKLRHRWLQLRYLHQQLAAALP